MPKAISSTLWILITGTFLGLAHGVTATPAGQARGAVPGDGPTVLITGSNRGIGFAFARQYAQQGWTVLATCRRPERADDLRALAEEYSNVLIERLDVTDHAAIEALARKYSDWPIDVLINNAGILGDPGQQVLENLDYEVFNEVMAVNVYGPLKMSQAFLEQVAASEQKKIVTLTSGMGSLARTNRGGGGFYFYRMSKTAVNMAMRNLQVEVRGRGIKVGILSPGAVGTRMLAQTGYRGPSMTPAESVAGLIEVIDGLTAENAGSFLQYDGREVPW